MVAMAANGQVSKKKELLFSDYNKWEEITATGISDDGKWACYSVWYRKNQTDTLFVKHMKDNVLYKFKGGSSARFIDGKYFVCITPGQQMNITELSTGKSINVKNVNKFDRVASGTLLFTEFQSGVGIRKRT